MSLVNLLSLPRKIFWHYKRGGIWAVAYLVTSRAPSLPLPRKIKWLVGRGHEIDFWDRYFQTKGLYWKSGFETRFDVDRPLDPYVAEVVRDLARKKIRMLDVGAGPMTSLSRGYPDKEFEIVAVDPLASDYDRIFLKYGYLPPIRTTYAEAEKLTDLFAANSFDIVHARNSIDHSYDPMRAIRQMLELTRPFGYVILQHVPNEATNEKWMGFHQWNFSKDRDCFVIMGKSKSVNVSTELAGVASVMVHLNEKADWLVVTIKKLN